ncbi:aspartyl-phosphate phosphatase Spo0E family protein [Neobacillus drentensis]|uniref:aspartyl-phosphate phosphatase Spo0E family protein n=1 Tax=Neobacillus drentensis TaxID=220684 RepID=UPI0023D96E20|nr:aspartyl-phosphate phosphatase Spo0E family protein [Neobacillus drentensis]
MSNLIILIEEKRSQLLHLSRMYGLNNFRTIQCSQQLDKLINLNMKSKMNNYEYIKKMPL